MKTETKPLVQNSDKSFWHGYIDFYETLLPARIDGTIIELGIFKGNSIRWLMQRYPSAKIIGLDIVPVRPEWPISEAVEYRKVDQGSEKEIVDFFSSVNLPDLIIEDGSHIPAHQSRCLKHGLNSLNPGGIYILEDIHTSLPQHPLYKKEFHGKLSKFKLTRKRKYSQTALSLLLALEHIKRLGHNKLTSSEIETLAIGDHFSGDEVGVLFSHIESIHVYKRTILPEYCYSCGSSDFDYYNFKCSCGIDLLGVADSMSILVRKKK